MFYLRFNKLDVIDRIIDEAKLLKKARFVFFIQELCHCMLAAVRDLVTMRTVT